MKTKIISSFLILAASVGTMFASTKIGDLYYNLDATNQTAEVTSQYSSCPYWLTPITTANIPSSVTYYSVSYSVTSIGGDAFNGCTSLTSVTIPNSVTSIGYMAFSNCSGLTSVTIGNSVTSIGNGAFWDCTSLTSVTIPNSVTSIGERAFGGCSGLTSINVALDNPNYCSVNGVLFNKNRTTLISYPGGKQGAYSIPNSVTSIGDYAFEYCTRLTSVTIPNSVTSIGEWAFSGCTSLTSVTIPNSVTSIGKSAFLNCHGLTSVTIPNSVTSIGDNAFGGCSGLTSINVALDNPNYCSVNGVLFNKNRTTLISYPGGKQGAYSIPNSVTSIGKYAFWDCNSLTSVTIPNSVTSIEYEAFYYCDDLTSVTNFANTPQEITSFVFDHVYKSTCILYVPLNSVDLYKNAKGWKEFKQILPISAEETEAAETTVETTETSAEITWPSVSGAYTYELVIKDQSGNIICTLVFDSEGRLKSITFHAPSRENAPQQAQAAGFSFTVTSLDSGTTYSYTMTAKDNNGNVLKTESGSFTTTGDAQGIEEISSSLQGGDRGRLILRNGQIFILRGEKVYTLTGQEVK